MNSTLNRTLLTLGIPLGLLGILVALMLSPWYQSGHGLDWAITVDLVVLVPLVYLALIWKTRIPKTTVVPVMVVGLVLGMALLPKEDQTYLLAFKTWALPFVELGLLSFITYKVYKAVRSYKQLRGTTPDVFDALKEATTELIPRKLAVPFATEVAVMYYGFLHWKPRTLAPGEFSYHKKSGSAALLGGLILIIAIETVAFHLLLSRWSETAAWILTVLSIYTALQFLGFAKALGQRPITLEEDTLVLRYSIMNETRIPLAEIDQLELSSRPLNQDKLTRKCSPLGDLERHNVVLHLKSSQTLVGLYGMQKEFRVLGLHVDDASAFVVAVQAKLTPQGEAQA